MKKKTITKKVASKNLTNEQKMYQAKTSLKRMMIEISPYLSKTKSKEISTVGQWKSAVNSVSY